MVKNKKKNEKILEYPLIMLIITYSLQLNKSYKIFYLDKSHGDSSIHSLLHSFVWLFIIRSIYKFALTKLTQHVKLVGCWLAFIYLQ